MLVNENKTQDIPGRERYYWMCLTHVGSCFHNTAKIKDTCLFT